MQILPKPVGNSSELVQGVWAQRRWSPCSARKGELEVGRGRAAASNRRYREIVGKKCFRKVLKKSCRVTHFL